MAGETDKRATVYAVTSGKGGAGKTTFVMNLAIELALLRNKVLLIDSDIGLANLHLKFRKNMPDEGTIITILQSEKKAEELIKDLEKIIYKPSDDLEVYIIAGSNASEDIFSLSESMKVEFETVFKKLVDEYDFIIFDCGAGITTTNTFFEGISDEIIICTNYEEAAVIGAYAKIKINVVKSSQQHFKMVVNKADKCEGDSCFKTLDKVVKTYLDQASFEYLGSVRKDDKIVKESSTKRAPIYYVAPDSSMRNDFKEIALKLLDITDLPKKKNINIFVKIKKLLFHHN